ncbi:hypothetical protein BC831DRAFT_451677 [Entophlyctis helioformis]|nr:hypothetical protein BC831DRAFT_451677 [Entophlyctis helioformis]
MVAVTQQSRKSSQASSAASACAAAGPTATCKKKTLRQQYSHKHTHKQQTKKHSVLPHHHHYQMPSLQSIRTLKKEAFRSLNTQIVHSQLAFVNRLAYYDSQPFSLFDQDDDTTMRGTIDDADSEDSGAHAYSDSDFDDLLDSMCDVSLSQDEYEQVYLFESHQALLDHEKQQAQDLSDSQPERRDHHKHRLQHPQQHEQRHTQDQQCSNTDSDDSEADLLVFDPQYREAAIGDLF